MTVPAAHQQLAAFDTRYAERIDPRTQVDRMPGTDAPCLCQPAQEPCAFPFCGWRAFPHEPAAPQ